MRLLRFATIGLAVAFAPGCGSGDETDSYHLVPVTGNVTLDGKPLDGARVIFTPQGNSPDTPGSDTTGKEGNFRIMYRGRAGVAKGKYAILVSRTLDGPAEPDDEPAETTSASEAAVLGAMDKQTALVAAGVKSAAKRGRSVIVTKTFTREVGDKPEVFDFDLKKP